MKRWLYILLAFATISFSTFGLSAVAFADVNDFVINKFDADYTLTNKDKQGSLHIIEDIDVTFSDFNHGILRAIPERYKGHSLQLKVKEVTSSTNAPTSYSTYSQNGNTVLKIGDKNRTITGAQNYKIIYEINNVIGFYPEHDELYWNINGTQWQQPFEKISAKVNLPAGISVSENRPLCFTGSQGSTETACIVIGSAGGPTINIAGGGQYVFKTNRTLAATENLSIVIGFKKGFFSPSTRAETFLEMLPTLLKLFIPVVLGGGYAFTRWRKFGRDAKGRGVIVPQYEPPKDMTPVEVGTLVDFNTSQKDVTAMIIDLAVRGYIIIHEETIKRALRKDKKEYSLELSNNDVTGLKDFERTTLEGLYKSTNFEKGSMISLSALKNEFYTSVAAINKQVKKSLVGGGYFRGDPTTAGGRLWGQVIALFAACFIVGPLFGAALIVGLVGSAVITIIFAVAMPARTAAGTDALEHAKGLKLYIETAEVDRIKMMQSPDSPYADGAGLPKKTVKLFEKLLPYAMIFGVEKEWAEQFEDIYRSAPGWYTGNMNTFSAIYLANSLGGTGFGTAMTTSFSSPSSSGSSGFSGGFSGGGGGGGGGGGW